MRDFNSENLKPIEKLKKMMGLKQDAFGKYLLRDSKGEIIKFSHAVDVREALEARDVETGEQMFFLYDGPEAVVVKKKLPVVEQEEEMDEEAPPPKPKTKKITTKRKRLPKKTN